MLKTKVFIKKTRKGGIVKIVREHYLRDDVGCGAEQCDTCVLNKRALSKNPQSFSTLCDFPHYILPDTNVVLRQLDVLEDNLIQNVILLQTVLDEVKSRSFVTYKRIREIIERPDKHFYVFCNEHHWETYVERLKGETPNDRNDRAIRLAASWYDKHLELCSLEKDSTDRVSIVLLTNDIANKEAAISGGIEAYTVHTYIKSITGSPDLFEKLAQADDKGRRDDSIIKDGKVLFPEHLSLSEIQVGLRTGKYFQGSFSASRENYLEGQVKVSENESIFIQGLANLNRSVDGDIVAVEILPKDRWMKPSSMVVEENEEESEETPEIIDDETKADSLLKPTGKVVGIVKRCWRQYCGAISPSGDPKGTRHLFKAVERRIPLIRIETRQAERLMGMRIIVSIDAWPRTSRYPQGHYVRILGEIGDKETETKVLLLEHDIQDAPFSNLVLKDLPEMPWIITPEDYAERRDLRQLDICSIDPPGCTDIDDALHCRTLDNGNFEIGVHIADVTHFIKPGTNIDMAAAKRGTSVYLADRRIDMIPALLSSDLCSLRSKVERFAFSCVWELTPNAEIVKTEFFKSILASKASLTYAEAQNIIDDPSRTDNLAASLRNLNSLAKILKKGRHDKGALILASSEVRFALDSETHDPIDLITKEHMETNSLVEEFMLLANISVAKKIYECFPQFAILRNHRQPPASYFEPLIKAGEGKNHKIVVETGKLLQVSLDQLKSDDPFVDTMFRILTTRCMTRASYLCSGTETEDNFYHFGLATPIYTHFTSPIRRYPDILVHRLLGVAIGAYEPYPSLLNKDLAQELCQHLNSCHLMAQRAGRASIQLHMQIFFKDRAAEEEGYILSVRKNAIQVLVPKFGLEGTVFLSKQDTKEKSPFTYDPENGTQTHGDIVLRVFDKVVIRISIAKRDFQNDHMQLKLVYPRVSGLSIPPIAEEAIEDTAPSRKKLRSK
ncbi:exosome complex exonuclease RRP44-like [Rhopilema esculentum]|uniref:exosome complex exonuclease RRP44-like n=1 Tax=Rhopilema esculentum TaxID=499914 RepID=UPI0031DE01F7